MIRINSGLDHIRKWHPSLRSKRFLPIELFSESWREGEGKRKLGGGGRVEEGKRGKFLFSSLHLPLHSPFLLSSRLSGRTCAETLACRLLKPRLQSKVCCSLAPRTCSHKCLEVQIDEKLSWECHAKMICKKVSAGIGAIRCIKNFVSVLWKQEEPSTEQPHSENCSPLWDEVHTTLFSLLRPHYAYMRWVSWKFWSANVH